MVARNSVCDICGDSAKEGLAPCRNASHGCTFGRHLWCFRNRKKSDIGEIFSCTNCCLDRTVKASSRNTEETSSHSKKREINGVKSVMDGANGNPEDTERRAKPFVFTSKPEAPQGNASDNSQARAKRPAGAAPISSRPSVRPRLEPSKGSTVDLFKSTMQGLQQEQRRRKASRQDGPIPLGAHASESHAEQRLKRRHRQKPKELLAELQQSLKQAAAASIQYVKIWSGVLELQLDDAEEPLLVDIVAHGLAENPHSMDAALRLPLERLSGSLLDTKETLEMSVLEASENACLVFRGASEESQEQLASAMDKYMRADQKLAQVLLGENKPLWMALIPAPGDACFGIFVKFDELWTHSKAMPSKGLLRQDTAKRSRKLEWPDGQDSNRRSTDCERGRGSDYGHLRIRNRRPDTHMAEADCKFEEPHETKDAPEVPSLGPLSSLSVAIIGFQRDHEEIKRLRRDLTAAGAQTFTAPWPGCVKVLVFPEQLFNKELTMENHAPKELQPIKDFQAAEGTRIFIRIDYPRLCCQLGRLPTPEEEARHSVKELWPEGIIVTADTATLDAAAEQPSSSGSGSLLEEVLEQLKAAAASARRPGTVWMLTATGQHLTGLGPAGHQTFLKWQSTRRFQVLEQAMATPDVVLNALKLAQFYRFFCRHTIVLARPEDQELIATAEARKTVFCVPLNEAVGFLQQVRELAHA